MIDKNILRQLESIDWDFPSKQPGETKIAHWYPGTFPSQLPAAFIQSLSQYGETIFDPYGGSGTTASESIRLQRKAIVIDINPVGIMANYAYCVLLLLKRVAPEKIPLFFSLVEELIERTPSNAAQTLDLGFENTDLVSIEQLVDKFMRPSPAQLLNIGLASTTPNWDSLSRWIHPKTLNDLKDLYTKSSDLQSSPLLYLFLISMISANLRAICSQNKSWGHIADNVWPKEFIFKDVRRQLKSWLKKLSNRLDKTKLEGSDKLNGIQYWACIHNWGSNERPKNISRSAPNLILTSPPYGDAIDYIKSQKLSLYYFGYNDDGINNLCLEEIGARRKRFKKGARERWATQMTEAAIKQVSFLNDGLFITILPHKNHGREIGINTMIEGLGKRGWTQVFSVDRSICQKNTRQSWTSIKQETISIFSHE